MNCHPVGHYFAHLVLFIGLIGCKSERGDAANDLDLANQTIVRISITDRNHRTLDIVDSAGIHYFLAHLNSLSARAEGDVDNEFDLTVYKAYDEIGHKWHITSLRMGKSCIGPMVPASDVATRWYFEYDSLYNFIGDKFHQDRSYKTK